MKLSIVTTLYDSEPYIEEFHQRATKVAQEIADDSYEIVFVNDGSPDGSLKVVEDLFNCDPHVVVVDLSRNFGHHKAMMTGLEHARGEQIFLLDSDLEEDPEWALMFLPEMRRSGADVVYGKQFKRKGDWLDLIFGNIFYTFFNWVSGQDMDRNFTTGRLMTRRYVDAMLQHRERELFLAGIWHITGFDQQPVFVKKHNISPSTYSFRKKVSIITNSITSFSNKPLIYIFYVGIFVSIFASLYIMFLVINWFVFNRPAAGWTSVVASVWLIGGIQISFVGIIGIYVAKIFSESKQRPYVIVRKLYRHSADPG